MMKDTTKQLIKQLRTNSSKERKDIAIELGKIASNKAIFELKKMVEGRWKGFFKWYGFEDQLIGIEALGETKREDVLEYLKYMYTPFISRKKGGSYFPGDDGLPDISERILEIHNYSNAPRRLVGSLSYEYLVNFRTTYGSHTTKIDKIPINWISESEIQRYKEEAIKNDTHQAFIKAIGKLESVINF